MSFLRLTIATICELIIRQSISENGVTYERYEGDGRGNRYFGLEP